MQNQNQRELLNELLALPDRTEAPRRDVCEPGALDADKDQITATIERAVTELDFGPYTGFMAYYQLVLGHMAQAYTSPRAAYAKLLRHADHETNRLQEEH